MKAETYTDLKEKLSAFEKQGSEKAIRLFYFATAPKFIENHWRACINVQTLHREAAGPHHRGKAFGTDLDSARKLNRLGNTISEKQYSASIITWVRKRTEYHGFPFCHYVFEPLWNKKYIDHIQVSVASR